MRNYLRNKATGEIRDVEADSPEFRELQQQVTAQGLPMWEQTNFPHAQAVKDRAATGDLLEEDLGHEAQDELRYEALKLDAKGVSPEANPHLQLTPAEIEMGLTPEQKRDDLQDMYDERVGRRRQIFDEAADSIADERVKPKDTGTQSARAGGSDVRANAPHRADNEGVGTESHQGAGDQGDGQ